MQEDIPWFPRFPVGMQPQLAVKANSPFKPHDSGQKQVALHPAGFCYPFKQASSLTQDVPFRRAVIQQPALLPSNYQ